LGQFFKIALDLRQYIDAKLALGRKNVIAAIANLVITSMVINPHMIVIQVQMVKKLSKTFY
jgi:predicted membrane protein